MFKVADASIRTRVMSRFEADPRSGRRRPKTRSREAGTMGKSFPRCRECFDRATTKPIVTNAREPRPLKMAVAFISMEDDRIGNERRTCLTIRQTYIIN